MRPRIALSLVTFLLAIAVGMIVWLVLARVSLEARNVEAHPIAEALQGESEENAQAWPPLQLDDAGASPDAGATDLGFSDVGPVPLIEAPITTRGYQAREGEHEGIRYLEVVLGDASFDDALPMVVMIHGRGGRAQVPGGPFLGLTHPVRMIIPQAPEPLGSGYQWLPVYVGQGLVDRLSSTLFQTASRLSHLLRDLAAERPTRGRIVVSGFSQGALLTLTLALYHDDLVGHAFPLASWMPPPLEPSYRRSDLTYPRIRSMHGTADRIIPLGPTRDLFGRLATLGFDVELVEFSGVEHSISEDENRLFHEWLEEAVCQTVGDELCAIEARVAAGSLPGRTPVDAGLFDAMLVPDSGEEDAGSDAGRRRRNGR